MACHTNKLGTIHVRIGMVGETPLRFKIDRIALLNKVFKKYREEKKILSSTLKFRDKNGMQLNGFETIASVGIQDDDLIEAFFQQRNYQDKFHIRIGLEVDEPMNYTMERYMKLGGLFSSYAEEMCFKVDGLQFFDENGNELKGTDSPGSLNMAQNALIRVVLQPQQPQGECNLAEDDDETIHLKIGQSNEYPTRFKVKRFMPLQKLFRAYADRNGLALPQLRFLSEEGVRFHGTDTPAALELQPDDLIVVYTLNDGGSR